MIAPTARFSDKVENYIKYRPGYPVEILEVLGRRAGWTPESVVADVGSGTGILTEVFLKAGNAVYAVEPNAPMREAAERLLADYEKFISVVGTAEKTTLDVGSVDLVVAGQAFHWFDQALTKVEFQRILKTGGKVALIWNERQTAASPFLEAYEAFLIQHGTDYQQVNHTRIDDAMLAAFFAPGSFEVHTFFNRQVFDREGLKGRLLSSSYIPREGEEGYDALLKALDVVFETHQVEGRVYFEYDTRVYLGEFDADKRLEDERQKT